MLHPSPRWGAFITPSLYPRHQVVGVHLIITPAAVDFHIHFRHFKVS